jgi:hypothetical protein
MDLKRCAKKSDEIRKYGKTQEYTEKDDYFLANSVFMGF